MATYRKFLLGYSPVSLWSLNDVSTPVAVDSAGTYNGTYQGNPLLQQNGNWTSYDNSKSVRFTRSHAADRVVIPDTHEYGGHNKLIIEAWFKPLSLSDNIPRFVFSRWGQHTNDDYYEMYIVNKSQLNITMSAGSSALGWWIKGYTNKIYTGNWYHCVMYKNAGQYRIYLNNVLLEAFSGFTTPINNIVGYEPIYIGYGTWQDGWFDGYINNVAFYTNNSVPDTVAGIDKWVDEHYYWKGGGSIVLLSNNERTSFDRPELKYKSKILLPFDIVETETVVSVYDNSAVYDKRVCILEANIDEDSSIDLIDFYNNSIRKNEGTATLSLGDKSGVFPFAPDKGDSGDFGVQVINFEQEGIGDRPYKYFKHRITIMPYAYPTYSIPASVAEGTLQIGTVGSLRFPSDWFAPESDYRYYVAKLEGADIMFINRGEDADRFRTRAILQCKTGKAGELINQIVNTIRAETFSITTQTDMYAFGVDKLPAATYTVRFTDGSIEVTHNNYDDFIISLPEMEFIA